MVREAGNWGGTELHQPTSRVVLGRILAPFGVKGWVKVEGYSDDSGRLGQFAEWQVGSTNESAVWRRVKVAEFRAHGAHSVARFEGCSDRDEALEYKGFAVAVDRSELPPAAAGEFYLVDLLGLKVINLEGEVLGHVAEVFSNGAHEILRVGSDGKEWLIPLVPDFVRSADVEAAQVLVDWHRDW